MNRFVYRTILSIILFVTMFAVGCDNGNDSEQSVLSDAEDSALQVSILANPGFEYPDINGFQYHPGGSSWSHTGNYVIANTGSAFGNTARAGEQNAVLQQVASISQSVNSFEIGKRYTVGWVEAGRGSGLGGNDLRVYFDDTLVGALHTVNNTNWTEKTSLEFLATSTTHILTFETLGGGGGDKSVFIDEITIVEVEPPSPATVLNPGFEYPDIVGFQYFPGSSSWSSTGNYVIANSGSAFGNTAQTGEQNAVLQQAASISQSISGFEIGKKYTVMWAEAARGYGLGGNDLRVYFDDTLVGALHTVNNTNWIEKTSQEFTATSASHTLEFETLGSGGGDKSVFIDSIVITEATSTLPDVASGPSPVDGASNVSLDVELSWTAGNGADLHDVYFGNTNPPPFIGSQGGTTYNPGTMQPDTSYYWRIDEKNASGTTTGTTWSFSTNSVAREITGISFDWSTHKRRGNGSDNWAITWADDDNQYAAWGDGWGYDENISAKQSLGITRIEGNSDSYSGTDLWYIPSTGEGGKSYGIVAIDSDLYMWYGPGSGVTSYDWQRLKKSTNYGYSWSDASWTFDRSDGLIMPTILNFGKGYDNARDDYVYVYFIRPQGNPSSLNVHIPGKIDLARVPTDHLMDKSYYEFFAGMSGDEPTWTSSTSVGDRASVFYDENGVGWNLSVSYNVPLRKYVMCTEHDASFDAKLGIFLADEPWGPWTTLAYYDSWGSGSGISEIDDSFFWNFSNKWLSSDGENFVMVFSGINDMDSWNTVEGSFTFHKPSPTIANPDFESPDINGYQYHPSGSGWSHSGNYVIANTGSAFGNTAYSGEQNAVLQQVASISQDISGFVSGKSYVVSWAEAGRGRGLGGNDLRVYVDNAQVAALHTVSSTSWNVQTSSVFEATSTTLNLEFETLGGGGGDKSVFIDAISISEATSTPPGAASNPSPADNTTGVSVYADLSWTAGSETHSHDLYFGTTNPPAFIGNQSGTGYDLATLDSNSTYYWRVDEKNTAGTTTGTVWSFTTADPDPDRTYTCTPIGSSYSDGFFSLKAFDGMLYAGQFGYGHSSQSMLYQYPPWELTQPGLTGIGESICAMEVFDGYLYANTEDSGDIYRSSDGSHWEMVHDRPGGYIGCGLEVFEGQLYAVSYNFMGHNHGMILRTSDGTNWSTVYDSGSTQMYVREITSYNGSLYAFSVDEPTNQGYMITSSDGTNWTTLSTPSRFMRGLEWNGVLYAGSADRRSNGLPGVWRMDGQTTTMVHQIPQHYVMEFSAWDGALWASTSNGWKDDSGPSSLIMSRDGHSWQEVCQFSETAAWSNTVFDGNLYVGTWDFGHGGKVYKVTVE